MKKYLYVTLPLLSVALASLLLFTALDLKIYDLFLKTLPDLKTDPSVLIIKVDDEALNHVGPFPWSRNILADGILLLKEMGAEQVVFDLSYLDHRPEEVDQDYLKTEYPQYIDENFMNLSFITEQFILDIQDGIIQNDDLPFYKDELLQYEQLIQSNLKNSLYKAYRDNDQYFANALNFFQNSFLTLSMVSPEDINDEDKSFDMSPYNKELLENHCSLSGIQSINDYKTMSMIGIIPAIENLLEASSGAGFVNASPDDDGYRRRVHLLLKYDDRYYGQLIIPALLERLGQPEIEVDNRYIRFRNALINDQEVDIQIPRARDGSILVKWPKKEFQDYSKMSSWELIRYQKLEDIFIDNLKKMREAGFLQYWDNATDNPLDFYENAQYIKETIFEEGLEESGFETDWYIENRNQFFLTVGALLSNEYENTVLGAAGEDKVLQEYVRESFSVSRQQYSDLVRLREEVYSKTNGSFCIIGVADATSMTDTGQTLFQERFPNVGIHSALANMILTQDFLDDSNPAISIVLSLLFTLGLSFYIEKFSTRRSLLAGIVALILSVLLLFLFFFISRKYIGVVVPLVSVALTFLTLSAINFIITIREKSFLRTAFSRYLSPDVIEEIIADPSKLNLGGEKKRLTAIFTDIEGFSGISEKMDPADLVKMLNLYLSRMSDIILQYRGTIDKYEGDAIISFFGAPIAMENHAEQACTTAIIMKKAELELNDYILKEGISDLPLLTRIGINTGEMIVGNMGTSNKMDYTVMGNSVNLAARLEGVNKRYRTKGILISEHTRMEIGETFILRKLDKVRVVGVQTPMRLYELIGFTNEIDKNGKEWLESWEKALEEFEKKLYSSALQLFQKIQNERMDDRTCSYYIERCKDFLETPPAPDWDGVFNLTEK